MCYFLFGGKTQLVYCPNIEVAKITVLIQELCNIYEAICVTYFDYTSASDVGLCMNKLKI